MEVDFSMPHFHFVDSSDEYDFLSTYFQRNRQRFFQMSCLVLLFEIPRPKDAAETLKRISLDHRKPIITLRFHKGRKKYDGFVHAEGITRSLTTAELVSLRSCCMMSRAERRGDSALLVAPKSLHFTTPSGLHVTHFLRVGDLFGDMRNIDLVAFWLRPELAANDLVLLDTLQISGPVFKAQAKYKLTCKVEGLSQHPSSNRIETRNVIRRLLRGISGKERMLLLNSINGSGGTARELCAHVLQGTLAPATLRCVHLFATSEENIALPDVKSEAWAVLSSMPSAWTKEECPRCKYNNPHIAIDAKSYYVKDYEDKPVTLGEQHFKPAKEFIARYGEHEDCFVLHSDNPNDGRHHAFDLDVGLLFENSGTFRSDWIEGTKTMAIKPDLIVTPEHAAGIRMAKVLTSAIGVPWIAHDDLVKNVSADQEQLISSSRSVLFVDDVINTGRRTRTYVKALREKWKGDFDHVGFAWGVNRTSSAAEYKKLCAEIGMKHPWQAHHFSAATFTLPHSDDLDCPWCAEFNLLGRWLDPRWNKTSDCLRWMEARASALHKRPEGILSEPLFLLPGVCSKGLGAASPLAEMGTSAKLLCFIIASGLQLLRTEGDEDKRLHAGFPFCHCFGKENLESRYQEDLLWAVIMRLVPEREWGLRAVHEVSSWLAGNVGSETYQFAAGEFLMACCRRSLTIGDQSSLDTISSSLGLDYSFKESLETTLFEKL